MSWPWDEDSSGIPSDPNRRLGFSGKPGVCGECGNIHELWWMCPVMVLVEELNRSKEEPIEVRDN